MSHVSWCDLTKGSGGMQPLPRTMLLRPGGIPSGEGCAFEVVSSREGGPRASALSQ